MLRTQFPNPDGVLLLLMAVSTILVCSVRFNRHDVPAIRPLTQSAGPAIQLGDAVHYVEYVKAFRGQAAAAAVPPPFRYRPAVPWLASLLPFEPMTAINVINVASLILALLSLHLTLLRLGFGLAVRTASLALFVFSFPSFYYGAIGYVDPLLICVLMTATCFLVHGQTAAAIAVVAIGVPVKETTGLLVPVVAVSSLGPRGGRTASVLTAACALALFLGVTLLLRAVVPAAGELIWKPSLHSLLFNAGRARTWVSLALAFGLPGLLGLISLLSPRPLDAEKVRHFRMLATGFACAVALAFLALLTAYADGRFIWTAYPFAIPLGAFTLERWMRLPNPPVEAEPK